MSQRYYIATLGCAMNYSDSARIASFLEKHKYRPVLQINEADLLIVNTCGIRQSAENRAYSLVSKTKKENKNIKILLTGCLSRRQDVKKRLALKVDYFMPISALPDMFQIMKNSKFKSELSFDEFRLKEGEKYLDILAKQNSSFSALVPIGNGCNNFCSYCVVPYARGREVYRSALDIILEVKDLLAKGYREIILIAQNVNSYNSGDYDFPKLLAEVANLKGDFWIRFFSSHPKDVSDKLIELIASSKKICPHLHLALQSGDDDILQAMNRKYTSKQFLEIIKKVKAYKKNISITTDIIVGYPGETEANFLNTVSVFRQSGFELAYISCYSPRPGTVSATLKDDVKRGEKVRREKVLEDIMFETSYHANKKMVGDIVKVLVEGKNRKGKYYGKTGNYKMIQITPQEGLNDEIVGQFVNVKINSASIMGLEAELISEKK